MSEAREIARNIKAQLDAVHSIERGARPIVKAYMGADTSAQVVDNVAEALANMSGYQGWSNRETWAAYLWCANEARLFGLCRAAGEVSGVKGQEELRTLVEGELEEAGSHGFAQDMLNAALARVNWPELHAAFAEA